MPQLGVAGIWTEPAAISPAMVIDRGEQVVFSTEFERILFGKAVLIKEADFVCTVQPEKTLWLIGGDANIAYG